MKIRRVINKRIAHDAEGIQAAGQLNAVIAINIDEQDAVTVADQRPDAADEPDTDPPRADSPSDAE